MVEEPADKGTMRPAEMINTGVEFNVRMLFTRLLKPIKTNEEVYFAIKQSTIPMFITLCQAA